MTVIQLTTRINAAIESCFDVARDIEVHKLSTKHTQEKAIAGRTTGLAELHDLITWEAIHFGIRQRLTVTISKFNRPNFFEDRMLKGAFKSMQHEHHFSAEENATVMTDYFRYEVPLGILGAVFDMLVLKRYMTELLETRNRVIKQIAETRN